MEDNYQNPDTWEQQQENSDEDFVDRKIIHVDPKQHPERIDKYLFNKLERVSRNKIQDAARSGSILVNGKAVKPNFKLKGSEQIDVILPTDYERITLSPEDIPLNIVFEDEHIAVINKNEGMVVHPGTGNKTGTLVNALLHHFGTLPEVEGNITPRPGLIHRLDKDTSGLIVVGKNEYALQYLANKFFNRDIERYYEALVWGRFDESTGTIEGNIGRHPRHRVKQFVFEDGSDGKPATTHYEVLETIGYISHVRLKLETGRTHQIRVHMAHIGHPIFGDTLYGGDKIIKGTVYSKYKQFVENCFKIMPNQALHAKILGFEHPETKEQMHFESELPENFIRVKEQWLKYANNSLKDGSVL